MSLRKSLTMLGSLFPFRLLLVNAVVTVDIVVRGGSVSVPPFELRDSPTTRVSFTHAVSLFLYVHHCFHPNQRLHIRFKVRVRR